MSYGHKNVKNGWLWFSDDGKKSVTVWEKYLSAPERSYWVLSENGIVIGFGVTLREILREGISIKPLS